VAKLTGGVIGAMGVEQAEINTAAESHVKDRRRTNGVGLQSCFNPVLIQC
jgi:hypothetical protein